jgi:hypothetical protein
MAQIDLSGAYMIPSKVYVGDRATLVLPLRGVAAGTVINVGESFTPDITIHHAAIERRPGGNFLTIEFSAYAPGTLVLPPLEIEGQIFNGVKIEISSILADDESALVLSGPALPLAIPGTSLLIYGSMSAAILLSLLAIGALFWWRKQMKGWLETWRRRRLIALMAGTEKRLRKSLAKGVSRREILDVLSTEFRTFLACFTGENCRAMTAAEIAELPNMDGAFLGGFFSHCDEIRFSGDAINGVQAQEVLGDIRQFLAGLAA